MASYETTLDRPLFERVPTGATAGVLPDVLRDRVMVDVIHDGAWIPPWCMRDQHDRDVDPALFLDRYNSERDWGGQVVAAELSKALGLTDWWRVNLARVVMDFGRFPGSTPPSALHLQRFAINYPFSDMLGFRQKRRILEEFYDRVSTEIDDAVRGKLIKLAIHTYDPYSANGMLRAPVSLITRVHGLHQDEVTQAFDPLYPSALGQWTADRLLRNRVSLTVEKAGFGVSHNYPYELPEGSIEVRAQVWRFFDALCQAFQVAHPETEGDPAFQRVWDMLHDTNLRSARCAAFRSYLHAFRRPPEGLEDAFHASQIAYERVKVFLERDNSRFVRQYRYAHDRPSAMAIEVRKDLVYEFEDGRPVRPRVDSARAIAQAIAEAVRVYLTEDLPERMDRPQASAGPKEAEWERATRLENPGA
jgi:hypothetical protein